MKQLGLFSQQEDVDPIHTPSEIETMRLRLLAWGKRHNYPAFSFPLEPGHTTDRRRGMLYHGQARWEKDTYPPHDQRENYPGEWLEKALHRTRGFDNDAILRPWQVDLCDSTNDGETTRS